VPWLRDAWLGLEHQVLRTFARRRQPTSAPTRIRTSGSVAAIQRFAKRAGFEVVDEHYDPRVSGADPIQGRKGFARASLVAKLHSGRERKRKETGKKVGGRKSHAELCPEVVAEARRLRRASPKTGQRLSFREISDRLEDAGHLNERGHPFNAQSVRARSRDRSRGQPSISSWHGRRSRIASPSPISSGATVTTPSEAAANHRPHTWRGDAVGLMRLMAETAPAAALADPTAEARGTYGIPPPRTVIGDPVKNGRTGAETIRCSLSASSLQCAGRKTTPWGTTPSLTKCHKAMRSLKALAQHAPTTDQEPPRYLARGDRPEPPLQGKTNRTATPGSFF